MTHCRECGIEFEKSDPLEDDICEGCFEAIFVEDDDPKYEDAFGEEAPFPEFDWTEECSE